MFEKETSYMMLDAVNPNVAFFSRPEFFHLRCGVPSVMPLLCKPHAPCPSGTGALKKNTVQIHKPANKTLTTHGVQFGR